MINDRVRRLAAATALGLLVALVWWLSPDPGTTLDAARHPQAYVDTVGSDQAAVLAVCVLAWLVLGWLAVGLLFGAAGSLPGLLGATCGGIADRLLPSALRRAAAVGIGLSVAAGGAGGAAALAHASPGPAHRPPAAMLAVDWPAGTPTSPSDTGVDWPAASPAHSRPRTVLVADGDCLWTIAARDLDPSATNSEIAAAWQRWYAANRTVIGADPDLIRPGQRLIAPDQRSAP